MMVGKVAGMAACVLALGLTSCGSSTPLSRAAFIRKADAVCRQAQARLAAGDKTGSERLQARGARLITAQREIAEGLERLNPPTDLSDTFKRYRSDIAARPRLVGQLLAATNASTGDQLVVVGRRAAALEARQRQQARTLGLTVCQ